MNLLRDILNMFKDKNMCMQDAAHNLTGAMQGIPLVTTLQQSNSEKLERAKEVLGVNWILHKDNCIKRKEVI